MKDPDVVRKLWEVSEGRRKDFKRGLDNLLKHGDVVREIFEVAEHTSCPTRADVREWVNISHTLKADYKPSNIPFAYILAGGLVFGSLAWIGALNHKLPHFATPVAYIFGNCVGCYLARSHIVDDNVRKFYLDCREHAKKNRDVIS